MQTEQCGLLTDQARLPANQTFLPGRFFSAFLNQLYIGQPYVPRNIYVPNRF